MEVILAIIIVALIVVNNWARRKASIKNRLIISCISFGLLAVLFYLEDIKSYWLLILFGIIGYSVYKQYVAYKAEEKRANL